MDDLVGATEGDAGGTGAGWAVVDLESPTRQGAVAAAASQGAEEASGGAGSTGGAEDASSRRSSQGPDALAVDEADLDEVTALVLMRKVLADPRPLVHDGLFDQGGAVSSRLPASRGCMAQEEEELPYRLKLELLSETIQKLQKLQREPGEDGQDTGGRIGRRLMARLRQGLQLERAAIARRREKLVQLQSAETLAAHRCAVAGRWLCWCAKAYWDLRFGVCLQVLWGSSSSPSSGPAIPTGSSSVGSYRPTGSQSSTFAQADSLAPLQLCVVGPKDAELDARFSRSNSTWMSGMLGTSKSVDEFQHAISRMDSKGGYGDPFGPASGTASMGPARLDGRIHILHPKECPCRKLAAADAIMGGVITFPPPGLVHKAAKNLQSVIHALQQLPLDTAVCGDDPYEVADAVHTLIRIATEAIERHFRSTDPHCFDAIDPTNGSESAEEHGWLRPVEFLKTERKQLKEFVARHIFDSLHLHIFPPQTTDVDLELHSKLARLSWIQAHHLDVPPALANTAQADRAGELLRRLHALRCPGDMLEVLAAASRAVTEAACLKSQLATLAAGRRPGSTAFGADESVPLFILVVLRARPHQFSSVLAYCERFTSREERLSKGGYALTQASSAAAWPIGLRKEGLVGLRQGEWESHMGSGDPA